MVVRTSVAGIGDSGLLRKVFDGFVAVFLLANLVIRFSTIFHYPGYNGYIAALLGCVVLGCVFVIYCRKYLKGFLFIFGFSFFLFGFPSMDMQSRLFEVIVTCVVSTLFFINFKKEERRPLNGPLVLWLSCYVFLSLSSLLLLPVRQILKDFWFFGFQDFFLYVSLAQPYHIYYPMPAITRLILYSILALQLASLGSRRDAFKAVFLGLFSGGIFCAFIGLLDFYGVISLKWYRFGRTTTAGVLHSTFGNRGVFAEFILTVVPFVLIGFMSKTRRVWIQVLLFGSLVVCEIALILAGARAGWVSYPLIIFICWVFFYFSKEGRLESFHFKWKDLVKVVISVPITILISFLLIFQVFMPLSEYMKTRDKNKGIHPNAAATTAYMKNQASRLLKPSQGGRLYTWSEGYHVGKEAPVYGMGYESFCRHAHILADVPESGLSKFYQEKGKNIHVTPHSVFFQLFASGGVVGLGLWLLIVGYAILILLFDLIKNKRLLNIPVMISIISFHVYGIFQSMQYMTMIWSLIFLNLGYALTVDDKVLPDRVRRVMGIVGKVAIVLVVIGFFVYLSNFESRSLAKKYDKRIYAMDQDGDRFAGFFQAWKWSYGDYRWFGRRGAVRTEDGGRKADDSKKHKVVELEFYCLTPGLERAPVVLTVFYEGKVLDEVVFSGETEKKKGGKKGKGQVVRRKYDLPVGVGEGQDLILEVSRTWIPHDHLKNFDRRELGVGVKVIEDR